MKYFKDKNNQIYALDEKDISNFKKPEWVEISKKEADEILNPAPSVEQLKQKELAELEAQIKETEGYIKHKVQEMPLLKNITNRIYRVTEYSQVLIEEL